MVLFIRSDIAFSSPLAGTPTLPPPPFTSDTFSRADSSTLGKSDAALGGAPMNWVGSPDVFTITNNRAVLKQGRTGSFFAGFAAPTLDVEVTMVVLEKPSLEAVWLDIRRPLAAVSPTQNAVRLTFEPTASGSTWQVQLATRANLVQTGVGPRVFYQPGDRVGLRMKGTTAQVLINGEVVQTAVLDDPVLQTGFHVGIAAAAGAHGFTVDDFSVTPI